MFEYIRQWNNIDSFKSERLGGSESQMPTLEQQHSAQVTRAGAPAPFFTEQPQETPEQVLHRQLYTADNWSAVVRLLHDELGLGRPEIARAAGVSSVTVARWLENEGDSDVRSPERLDDLRFVVLALLQHGAMTKRLLRFWLAAKDVELRTDALTAIAEGRLEEVIEAGKAVSQLRRVSA
jgi:hypothetical protein